MPLDVRRLSIATAADEDGNPNVKLLEDEEERKRLKIAAKKKQELHGITPVEKEKNELGSPSAATISLLETDPRVLFATDQFFLTKASADFWNIFNLHAHHAYGLLNSSGERISFVVETQESFAGAYSNHRSCDFSVLGRFGGVYLEISGSTKEANIMQDAKLLGTIVKNSVGLTYNIKNQEHALFNISPSNTASPVEFNVCATGQSDPIGVIKQKWLLKDDPKLQTMYGMTLPKHLSYDSKVLLVSTFIILYFLFFQPAARGENRKRFWQGVAFSLGVGAVILFMILIIVLWILFLPGPAIR